MPLRIYTKFVGFIFLASMMASCQLFRQEGASWQVNKKWYRQADVSETSVRVSLHDQKAWLLDGAGRAILKTSISTGVPGHETPTGELKVLEKIEGKKSNRYGKYVDEMTGEVVVAKSWLHKGSPPVGTVYEGIAMPYWMRLTWWGVGMHVGKFPKHTRCSFGCIRVFRDAQPWIYRKTQVGTPVTVESRSLVVEMDENEKFGWRSLKF